jgi:lantibiotic biosynthesis protein
MSSVHLNSAIKTLLPQLRRCIQKARPEGNGLMGGRLGLCLYYTCLHQHTGRTTAAKAAIAHLERVLEAAEIQPMGYNYASGLAGLAYMMHYMRQNGLTGTETDDYLRPLDDLLYENALRQLHTRHNDFLHGAMGTVHYFTSRLPHTDAAMRLTHLLTAFCNQAIQHPQGNWFASHIAERSINDAEINLGLSHGQCGFLLLLLAAYEKGIRLPVIPAIVEKGIELILHYGQCLPDEHTKYSCWPLAINSLTYTPAWSARLAWCYGDLNVLLLLYRAAAILQRPQWAALANERGAIIAPRTAAETTMISNSHFCHGSSGLAQFYHCLHRQSEQPFYYKAYEYWLQRTLNYLPAELNSGIYRGKEGDLLEGLAGIALVLLEVRQKQPLEWAPGLLL